MTGLMTLLEMRRRLMMAWRENPRRGSRSV